MQIKRWESPRRRGRNDKGKGGSARKRQLNKQQQMLRKRLKDKNKENETKNTNNRQGGDKLIFPYFLGTFCIAIYESNFIDIPQKMEI